MEDGGVLLIGEGWRCVTDNTVLVWLQAIRFSFGKKSTIVGFGKKK